MKSGLFCRCLTITRCIFALSNICRSGTQSEQWRSHYLPLQRVMEIGGQLDFDIAPIDNITGNGPSENYKIKGAAGSFGLIHPVSSHFCEQCNRLRLTADGNLKPCLYWVDELNIKPWIGNKDGLKQLFMRAMDIKPQNHEMAEKLYNEAQTHEPTNRRMSQIGG